ncbi:MAG: hypothetical protein JO126_06805 [Alphaproteobacteria bacterium]|nr:hypothetical protein [Alphaproteobacteria bacterium]MBV8549148.1 hypothetical protein [Alphaproteobacteria bacterium]
MSLSNTKRLSLENGIALGPIIFIIAILAILAAVISAGSTSFNGSATTEGNKTKAAGLIQIGDNLRAGMDRLTMENGVAWGAYNINAGSTVNTTDLFAPLGGGITAPSIALAGNAQGDIWYYPKGAFNGMGTINSDQMAVLNVAQGVCQEINNRANGMNSVPSIDMAGSLASSNDLGAAMATNITSATGLYGKPVGCLKNTNASGTSYWFYEVIMVQ